MKYHYKYVTIIWYSNNIQWYTIRKDRIYNYPDDELDCEDEYVMDENGIGPMKFSSIAAVKDYILILRLSE